MNKLPLAKTQDIVIQDLGKEILIYDLVIDKAFCLNETSSIVFRNCTGLISFEEFGSRFTDFSEDLIFLTLDMLNQHKLLQTENYKSVFEGTSRRQVIKKIGLMSLVALPIVSAVVAPTSAMARSSVMNCGGTIAPNMTTEWSCSFNPTGGDAEWCNEIGCDLPIVSHRCQSCVAKAQPAPGFPNVFVCYCT